MTPRGLRLPRDAPFATLADMALEAERRGFDSVWFSDDGDLEPFTVACGLAARTSSVKLGVLVAVGDRNPAVVAKQATALDVLSHGRALLGLASEDPGRLEEAVQIIRAMFRDERPTVEGHITGAFNRPPPVRRGGPPILIAVPPHTLRGIEDIVLVDDMAGATD